MFSQHTGSVAVLEGRVDGENEGGSAVVGGRLSGR